MGFVVGVRGNYRHADHGVRLLQRVRRLEKLAVQTHRRHALRRKVPGEREGQTQSRRQTGAEIAGSKQPDRNVQALARNRAHRLGGVRRAQEGAQLIEQFGEVQAAARIAAQGALGQPVAARRAAQAQVDASGKQGFQRAELFGDEQRRVVRQHHTAGPHPQGGGVRGNVADQNRRGAAGDAIDVVVLGEPEALVTQLLHVPREVHRITKRVRGGAALRDGREVQH